MKNKVLKVFAPEKEAGGGAPAIEAPTSGATPDSGDESPDTTGFIDGDDEAIFAGFDGIDGEAETSSVSEPKDSAVGGGTGATPEGTKVEEPSAPPAAAAQPAPEQQTPAAPPAEAAPSAQPQVQPPVPPVQGEQTSEAVAASYQTWRQGKHKELAEKYFALSEEEVAEIETNPAAVVPQLMAKSHLAAVEASVMAVANLLPQVIRHVVQQDSVTREAEDAFFGQWPALKDDKYRQTLTMIGQTYRSMNPTASREDFIKDVGASAMAALKLGLVAPAAPAMPQAPAAPGITPHAPIGSGPATALPRPTAPSNPFAAMAEEDLADR